MGDPNPRSENGVGELAESVRPSACYVTTTDGDRIQILPGEYIVGTWVNPNEPAVFELVRDGVAVASITGKIERA